MSCLPGCGWVRSPAKTGVAFAAALEAAARASGTGRHPTSRFVASPFRLFRPPVVPVLEVTFRAETFVSR